MAEADLPDDDEPVTRAWLMRACHVFANDELGRWSVELNGHDEDEPAGGRKYLELWLVKGRVGASLLTMSGGAHAELFYMDNRIQTRGDVRELVRLLGGRMKRER